MNPSYPIQVCTMKAAYPCFSPVKNICRPGGTPLLFCSCCAFACLPNYYLPSLWVGCCVASSPRLFCHHCHELVLLCKQCFLLVFQELEECFLRHCHRRRVFSCVVEFRLEAVGVLNHGLLVGGGNLVSGDVGGRFG